jgi:hypothetical protein
MASAASARLLPAPQGVRLHEIPARCRDAAADQQLRRPPYQKQNRLSAAGPENGRRRRCGQPLAGLAAVPSIPSCHPRRSILALV